MSQKGQMVIAPLKGVKVCISGLGLLHCDNIYMNHPFPSANTYGWQCKCTFYYQFLIEPYSKWDLIGNLAEPHYQVNSDYKVCSDMVLYIFTYFCILWFDKSIIEMTYEHLHTMFIRGHFILHSILMPSSVLEKHYIFK